MNSSFMKCVTLANVRCYFKASRGQVRSLKYPSQRDVPGQSGASQDFSRRMVMSHCGLGGNSGGQVVGGPEKDETNLQAATARADGVLTHVRKEGPEARE